MPKILIINKSIGHILHVQLPKAVDSFIRQDFLENGKLYLSITPFLNAFSISLNTSHVTTWMVTGSIVFSCSFNLQLCNTLVLWALSSTSCLVLRNIQKQHKSESSLSSKEKEKGNVKISKDETYSMSPPNMLPQVAQLIFPNRLDKKVSCTSQHASINHVNWIFRGHHCMTRIKRLNYA